jgi:hypothetical protein
MTLENQVLPQTVGEITATDPPVISPKPGWETSEGQITAVVSAVLTVLTGLGIFHITQDQANSVLQLIHDLFAVIVPVAGVVLILWNYITSRGKTKSNAINATAAVQVASLTGNNAQSLLGQPAQFASLGGFHTSDILGGKNWKDPKRYLDIAKIAGEFLPAPVSKTIDAVAGESGDSEIDTIIAAIKALNARQTKTESDINAITGTKP